MSAANNKIAAVIVTYNRLPMLKKCVDALLRQNKGQFDILLIDNASTDGTGDYGAAAAAGSERIFYHNTGANLGGAGGFSYGIRTGVTEGYEYLWLMDDDTIAEETALEELLRAAATLKDEFGFLSSLALWTDGTPCRMNIPEVSEHWWEETNGIFEQGLMRINCASFVSLFLKASVVKQVGLPIKEFFIWGDDTEYTMRISRQYPCYFAYRSKVVHEMKSNNMTSIQDEAEGRLNRYRYLYRNLYYIARSGRKKDQLNYMIEVKNTVKDLLRSGRKDKWKRVRIVLGSYLSGMRFRPEIEYPDSHGAEGK